MQAVGMVGLLRDRHDGSAAVNLAPNGIAVLEFRK